jgi:hypothetical protein
VRALKNRTPNKRLLQNALFAAAAFLSMNRRLLRHDLRFAHDFSLRSMI